MDNLERYLQLLKQSLLNELYLDNEARILYLAMQLFSSHRPTPEALTRAFLDIESSGIFHNLQGARAEGGGMHLVMHGPDGSAIEAEALRSFCTLSHSMIGRKRMDNLHQCLDRIVADKVPGDLLEAGVWKGGATIFMRGYLAAHGIADRTVWAADSFEGLPKPELAQDFETGDCSKDTYPNLAVSLEEVRALFERYGLLDAQVQFLKGWFKDTLLAAPIEQLALLRLDGDMYSSTMDALRALYHKVAPGGFVIIDDYHSFAGCKQAVDNFRRKQQISEPMEQIDVAAVYWRKS